MVYSGYGIVRRVKRDFFLQNKFWGGGVKVLKRVGDPITLPYDSIRRGLFDAGSNDTVTT